MLPTHSHSALALICRIGQIPHPKFEERTISFMSKIAATVTECSSQVVPVGAWYSPMSACMDVGEPRVTWRLATCLRLASFGNASSLFMQYEEGMLQEMRSWKSGVGALSALKLLSPRDSHEAEAELAMGRCLADAELHTSPVKRAEIASEVLKAISLFPFRSRATAKNVWKQVVEIENLVSDSSLRPDVQHPRWKELRKFLATEC